MRTDTRWARPHEKIPLPTRRAGRPVPVSFPSAGAQRNGGEMRTDTRWARPHEKIPLPARRAGRPSPFLSRAPAGNGNAGRPAFAKPGGENPERRRAAQRRRNAHGYALGAAFEKIPPPRRAGRPIPVSFPRAGAQRNGGEMRTDTRWARPHEKIPLPTRRAGRPIPVSLPRPGGQRQCRAPRARQARRRKSRAPARVGTASQKIPLPGSPTRPAAQGGRSPFLSRAPAALPARSLPFSGAGVAL